MLNFVHYPSWIQPEIISGLPLRWYGLMYVAAFAVTYLLLAYQVRHDERQTMTSDDIISLLLWCIIGLLVGARLAAATIYDPSGYYLSHPWMIFWPFRGGSFVGLQGMSYHGGAVGAIVGGALYAKKNKRNFFELADLVIAGVPLGYTFGRLGNFMNAELWGRVTTSPLGMIFPTAPSFSSRLTWVRETAEQIGISFQSGAMVNLPRHPSQLYEALFEGVILWLFIWFIVKRKKRFHGQLISWYLIGYGAVRFVIEYFREPDSDLGFILALGAEQEPAALFLSPWNFSMGQLLCFLMIAAGSILLVYVHDRYPASS